jgi:hypothetical protein
MGTGVGVENDTGEPERRHRGTTAAACPALARGGSVGVRRWPGELLWGSRVADGSSDGEGVNRTGELGLGSGHGMAPAWRLGSCAPGAEKGNDRGHHTFYWRPGLAPHSKAMQGIGLGSTRGQDGAGALGQGDVTVCRRRSRSG